jgi:hypothetical protein
MFMNALPKPMELAANVTNQATATEIILRIGDVKRMVRIDRVMVNRISGTATTYQPAIGNVGSFTTGTSAEKYLATSVPVATQTDDTAIEGLTSTDLLGNLYLRCAPNAGADNAFSYAVVVSVY